MSLRTSRTAKVILMLSLGIAQLWAANVASAAPINYYVNCSAGSDAYAGTSTTRPWRTMAKASQAPLNPGDQLLLLRGCAWLGPLRLSRSGTASQRIYVGTYSTGLSPVIKSSTSGIFDVIVTGSYITIDGITAKGVAT